MGEEGVRGAPGHRPAGRAPTSAHAHQTGPGETLQGSGAGLNAANGVYFHPGDGLVIGDDGQDFGSGARQFAARLAGDFHLAGQIRRGSKTPRAVIVDEIDPAP